MNLFDIVILIAIALFTLMGAKRGLIMTLCGLVVAVLALIGSPIAADALSPMVAEAIRPGLETTIQAAVDEAAANGEEITIQLPEAIEESGLIEILLNSEVYQHFAAAVESGVEQGMDNVAAGVAEALSGTLAWFVVYLAAFIGIVIAGNLIARVLDLAALLPGLHFINKSLGGLCGFFKGIVYAVVVVSLAISFGLIPAEHLEGSLLVELLSTYSVVFL